DWYDFLWYTSQDIGINYDFLSSALRQQGPWKNEDIHVDLKWCLEHLEKKVSSVDWEAAREDVQRFIKAAEQPSLELWSRELFLSQVRKIKE
ncbi:nucleotidyl transferase AbiEii/AbiGii toxin family protein, partial [Candidatus Bathyarchaeota archaeon]|nr:nucleotidyl transferase AbiEii/AbiGii toxin family protein [Candidatus Bathyarchaeota archaeon]